jgi:hypothetical protein
MLPPLRFSSPSTSFRQQAATSFRKAASPPFGASSAFGALSRLFSAHCPPALFQTGPVHGVSTFRVTLARPVDPLGSRSPPGVTVTRERLPGPYRPGAPGLAPGAARPFRGATSGHGGRPLQGRYRASLPAGRRRFFTPVDRRDPPGLHLPGGHASIAGGPPVVLILSWTCIRCMECIDCVLQSLSSDRRDRLWRVGRPLRGFSPHRCSHGPAARCHLGTAIPAGTAVLTIPPSDSRSQVSPGTSSR